MRIIVLGAGIIGAAIAESLAVRGAEVTVLDMRSAGRGATQASAGILAPYIEAHDSQQLLDLCTRSLGLFDDFISRIVSTSGKDIEYTRTGTLEVALEEADAARLGAASVALTNQGIRSEWLDPTALGEFEPQLAPSVLGGLFIPAHGTVKVASLMSALVESARFSGGVFESPVEAVGIESRREDVLVRAGAHDYDADFVVIAAGSWSKRIRVANVAALPMRPVRGQLLHLHWTDSPPPARVVWGPRCYTVPWADRSLLVGATVEDAGFDENATASGVHALTSAAIELFPGAAKASFEAVRVGLRPALPDGLPAIGPIGRAPRVIVATGHYRNGILLCPLTAQMVTGLILDGVADDAFAVTSPDRFLG